MSLTDTTTSTVPVPDGAAAVRAAVTDVLARVLGPALTGPLDPAAPFEDLGADSLTLVESAALLAQRLGVPVDEQDLDRAGCVDGVVELLAARTGAAAR